MTLRPEPRRPRLSGRRGSTLIVVIALLASLMLLGFLFLTIASQEQENAYLFSEAAKVPQTAGSDYFDFALEQLILGPRDDLYNSALWGGRASLLPTMFGNDLQPYNGAGVNLSWVAGSGAVVDQDFNGSGDYAANGLLLDDGDGDQFADSSDDWGHLNLSPAAWLANGTTPFTSPNNTVIEAESTVLMPPPGAPVYGMANLPAADVEYTYPDLSSPFLAYVGYEPTTGKRVILPSFHRPQYLRDLATALGILPADWPTANAGWYADPDLARRSMRPHRAHVAVTDQGNDSGETRFVSDPMDADATGPQGTGVFPFETTFDGSTARNEGVWWGNVNPADPVVFDADPDNDGVNEAVLIDLDYPVQQSADGSKTFVPLFAITVYDADALFNLNAHGNAYGNLAMDTGSFGDVDGNAAVEVGIVGTAAKNEYLSRSNQAVGPHEVNAQVGLDASITAPGGAALDPATLYFGHVPASDLELANMEWWFLLAGRADIDTAAADPIKSLYPGRWGEDSRLRTGTLALRAGNPNAPNQFPYPGASGIDDETPAGFGFGGDAFLGAGATGVPPYVLDPNGMVFPPLQRPPHEQPLDYRGQGRFVARNETGLRPGKDRVFDTTAFPPFRLPQYLDYAPPGSADAVNEPNWRDHGPSLVGLAPWRGLYSVGGESLVDHPQETVLDASSPNSGQDAIFSPGESATLQFSAADQAVLSVSQRLLDLVPYNFKDADGAQDRRKMFTTASADLKTYGAPVHTAAVAARPWEFQADPSVGTVAFPPYFPAAVPPQVQPFREEVRALLRNVSVPVDRQMLMRKLSVNHVAELVTNPADPSVNRIRLRPLTSHPTTGLTSAPLSTQLPGGWPTRFGIADYDTDGSANDPNPGEEYPGVTTWQIGTPAAQEWHARRDRQNLARDIYVLLYTLGKADTTAADPLDANTITDWVNGTGPIYSLRELREMAQFAVNVVDAMDPDDTATCFVYDLNLADGYTNLDDGYASPIDPLNNADANAAADADGDGVPDNDFYDQTNMRGMVYGVETQRLALNEAMFVFAAKVTNSTGGATDHALTEWDDSDHRDFSFIELVNVTPESVDFGDPATPEAGEWQIVVKTRQNGTPPVPIGERRLTLLPPANDLPGAAAYTILAAGDDHNRERGNPTTHDPGTQPEWTVPPNLRSRMMVNATDPKGGITDYTNFFSLAPFGAQNATPTTLDLLNPPPPGGPAFRLQEEPATGYFADGAAAPAFRPYSQVTTSNGGLLDLGDYSFRDTVVAASMTPNEFTVTVELRRRLNMERIAPTAIESADEAISQDNPWITVDRIEVPLQILKLLENTDNDGSANDFAMLLNQNVRSVQRGQPLYRQSEALHTSNVEPENAVRNSLAAFNTNMAGTAAMLWQPHYDRPFASLGDLLGVPLYGPSLLTGFGPGLVLGTPDFDGAGLAESTGGTAVLNRAGVAAARVLFPDGGTGDGGSQVFAGFSGGLGTLGGFYDNLWYRIFEYVTVPEADGGRQNYVSGSDASGGQGDVSSPWFTVDGGFPFVNDRLRRSGVEVGGPYQRFGKLNLNTLRHPHVFAGMIDDFSVMGRPIGQGYNPSWLMPSATAPPEAWDVNPATGTAPGPVREWWRDFLLSRDGFDVGYTNLVLPGLPVGRPFGATSEIIGRPFRSSSLALRAESGSAAAFGDHWGDFQRSLADTVFRRLPMSDVSTNAVNVRGLFELGGVGETDSGLFDFTTRYRLLSKVLNHSTTRSNVFLVFVEVKFFNAKVKYTAGGEQYVRIGAPDAAAESPRAFFVVDRTKALELISADDLPQNNRFVRAGSTTQQPVVTSSFARNPDGSPTFDWRALILSGTRIE